MNIERREGEGMTEFTIRRIRAEIIEECALEIEKVAGKGSVIAFHVRSLAHSRPNRGAAT